MQRRYAGAHMQFGLAGEAYLRSTALLTVVWRTVTMAR